MNVTNTLATGVVKEAKELTAELEALIQQLDAGLDALDDLPWRSDALAGVLAESKSEVSLEMSTEALKYDRSNIVEANKVVAFTEAEIVFRPTPERMVFIKLTNDDGASRIVGGEDFGELFMRNSATAYGQIAECFKKLEAAIEARSVALAGK